ncbi:MAG: deoxyguanosinetriphosphate triphosphohydrolase [Pontibacterium sp.]
MSDFARAVPSLSSSRSMSWEQLLLPKRYGHTVDGQHEHGRSHYHKDHDRIVFSSAFRRLGRKTQVHPLALNDHIHTRLTHSIEVGSIGRSLGIRVGEQIEARLPSWVHAHDIGMIVQSACLAHDIGNPPFGHAGEYAIRDWFRTKAPKEYLTSLSPIELSDLETFEGNAQGLRVVSCIENHLFDGGLRLTYPTLGAMLKYPWTVENATAKGKFSCFQSELPILSNVARSLGLVADEGGKKWCRHPLCYLVEAADDICYAILDLEDAIELNILSFDEVKPLLLKMAGDITYDDEIFTTEASSRRKISALRGKAMENMVSAVVKTFMAHYDDIMAGQYDGVLLSDCDMSVAEGIAGAKKLAIDRVFPDTRKTELEVGAYITLGILLDAFCHAVYANNAQTQMKVSYQDERVLSLMGIHAPQADQSLYESYRRALDFISGMTDNYASYLARQMSGRA